MNLRFSENNHVEVIVQNDDDDDIQIGGVTIENSNQAHPPKLIGNAKATYAILETINRNLNQSKRSNNNNYKP